MIRRHLATLAVTTPRNPRPANWGTTHQDGLRPTIHIQEARIWRTERSEVFKKLTLLASE